MEKNNENKPLYQQVMSSILDLIQYYQLKPGDPLPTEAELESLFQVSRTTIRTATSELQSSGYITKRQGKGTFVASNTYEDCYAVLQSFSRDACKRGITMSTVMLSSELTVPNDRALDFMGIEACPMLRIQRLRYIDDIPTILTTSYLPSEVYEKLNWKKSDFCSKSLYEELELIGIDMEFGEEIVEVTTAGILEASLLQVDIGHPLACNQRKVYNKAGELVEYGCSFTRGEDYRLNIKLRKRQ